MPLDSSTVVPEELPLNDDGVGLLPLIVIIKSEGLLVPPPSLITCFVTTNVPTCDLSLEVSFDESDVEADEEDKNEDVFASIRAFDFLGSFISDIEDEGNDDNDDLFSLFLLSSSDSAYEFKSTEMDKTSTKEIIKRRKLNANLAVTFEKDMFSFTYL